MGLLQHWNIHDTGHLHTLLPLYPGQQVRLTEKLSGEHDLFQDTEGTVLHIIPDSAENQDITKRNVKTTLLSSGRLGML